MKRALCLLALAAAAFGQEDVVVKAMGDELARSMAQLRLEGLDKPYFISYRVLDVDGATVSASLGQLTASNVSRSRFMTVQVRVGDYKLDNTNFIAGRPAEANLHTLPLDADYEQIRRQIWLATDAEYKQACAALAAKRSVLERRKSAPALPDFTRQSPVKVSDSAAPLQIDVPALERLARGLSAVFRGSPEILTSDVEIWATNDKVRQVDSEGASFTELIPAAQLRVSARTQAADGSPLADSFNLIGRSIDVFRGERPLARTRALLAGLKALRAAPVIDRYNGPVLFEDEAAAQVVAQVFVPAVTAIRIPISGDPRFENQIQQVLDQFGASLADRLGSRVLPEGFDVIDNPLLADFNAIPLVGRHAIDSEAVPRREVRLVENGRLKALLATRTPTAQTEASTGSADTPGMASPGNVFLTAHNSRSAAELRQELLKIAKERGYGYGIVVRQAGDAALNGLMRMAMSRMAPDAGAGIAAYKVFEDGHEELVRTQIAPVPVAAFKDIVATGDKPAVHSIPAVLFMGSLAGQGPRIAWSSFIVPPLLFEEVSLKAPSGPSPTSPVAPSPMAAAAE